MEMDYSTYAQLVSCANMDMPAPESFYPEINGSRQWNVEHNNGKMTAGNCSGYLEQTHETHENMSEGTHNPSPMRSPTYQGTSASAYRSMARERKRMREMQARNGLYSPMESSVRFSGGDGQYANNYSDYTANGMYEQPPNNGNSYW